MDQKTVGDLERELEKAMAKVVIARNKNGKLPPSPSQHTLHFMAKAAVAVYEATVDSHDEAD